MVLVSKITGSLVPRVALNAMVVVTRLVVVTGTKEDTQQIRKRWIACEAVFEK